mgnify:CR=1 FL=1
MRVLSTNRNCKGKGVFLHHKFMQRMDRLKNYDRYELAGFSEEAKRKYREEHWEEDLQKAFDAGKRMAEKKD